jgi:hypothetical protein
MDALTIPQSFYATARKAPAKAVCAVMLSLLAVGLSACGPSQKPAAGSEATLVDLNRAVAAMTMVNGRCPANVYELTNFPSLRGKTLPTPPAGKKLVIDPATRQVVIAAQ